MNCFTLKFFFTCNKTTESDKNTESTQSEWAAQPKYLQCEVNDLSGNYLWFDNLKDC